MLNHEEHGYEILITRQERTAAEMFDLAADTFIRNGGAKVDLILPSDDLLIYVVGGESQKDDA